MRKKLIVVVAISTVLFLPGCAFFRAMTFQSDDQTSFQQDYKTVILQATAPRAGQGDCKSDGGFDTEAAPALAAAAGAIAINIIGTEITTYLDKKKKEFSASYSASKNLPYYYIKSATGSPPTYEGPKVTCLRLVRYKMTGGKEDIAFEWFGALYPNDSGTALMIRTGSIKLRRAAARTDAKTRKVDVSVEVKIDAITTGDKGAISSTTVADKVLRYQDLTTPGNTAVDVPAAKSEVESSYFPAIPRGQNEVDKCTATSSCKGVTALSISVMVTETGSGADDFGTLGKEIDDNKKTLSDAVSKWITDHLTPKSGGSSSGSSKGT